MAAPAFGAAGTFVEGIGDVSPAWPTHATDDIALLIVNSFTGQAAVLGTPAGFVEVTNSPQDSNAAIGGHRTTVFWCRATSGAMTAPTVTDPGSYAIAIIITFTGCITSGDPWDVTSGSNTGGTDTTSVAIPGATTTGADRLVVSIVGTGADVQGIAEFSGWANADLTSVTEIVDRTRSISSGGGFGAATGVKAVAGAYGNTTATAANTSGLSYMSIALRSDAGAGIVVDDPPPPTWRAGNVLPPFSVSPSRIPAWRFFYADELAIVAADPVLDEDGRYASNVDLAFQILARQPFGWFDDVIVPEAATVDTPVPPGPTLTAMQAGNVSTKWVAAIEGYGKLVTDGDVDAVAVAWSGTGYDAAIGGLYVRHSPSQSINPWNPFENTGGSLTLQVVTDSFGVDTHIKSGGTATYVEDDPNGSIDCDELLTVNVKSAASFASSGTMYIGTEAIGYSGKTSTSFTGLTRGKYSPFLTEGDANFAHPHTIAESPDAATLSLPPVVSSTPRSWLGKWVGLWRHLQAGGLLNVKDDALCVFAGRITGVRDNPATMTTDVECQHVLEYVRDAVLGESPWKATIEEGITLVVDQRWAIFEHAAADSTVSDLVVVAGVAANDYEIQAGRYSLTQVNGFVNKWLDQAVADSDLEGFYKVGLSGNPDGTTHGKFMWKILSGPLNGLRFVKLTLPWRHYRALGGFAGATGADNYEKTIERAALDNAQNREDSINSALRSSGVPFATSVGAELIDVFGEFLDQTTSLPDNLLAVLFPGIVGEIGLCMLNDRQPVVICKDGNDLLSVTGVDPMTGAVVPDVLDVPFDDHTPLRLRQIAIFRGTFATVLKSVLCSTGTTHFNHSTYDTYPENFGLGIPFDILGDELFESIDRLAHADQEITVILDRPKKLVDILGACLKLRFAFLRWINGHLEFFSWMTPTTGDVLEEGNKASPVGNQDEQRSASDLSDRWVRNVIKIDYDKDFTVADTGDAVFHSHATVIDRAGIDDAGGKKSTETIPDPTSFTSSFLGGSGSLDAVIADFKGIAPMFTRPVRTSKRTIAPTFFEGHSVGDCVIVTDEFARDPDTGDRGVSARPGIIVSHGYEPGGFEVGGGIADMHGEVEILFLDLLRVGPYVPAANVASVSGTVITCNAHDYSLSDEAADATHFPALSKIRIVERDPANPAAPLSWDRVVSSQTGNTITLTAALSSPTYDAALSYRVIWDDYTDAVAAQQVYSYQADDADYQIADTRAPYQYTANTGLIDFGFPTPNTAADTVELPPDSSYGDGVGLDVGHMHALNRLANNLYDYKTAASAPILFPTIITVDGAVTHDWQTVLVMPIQLGVDTLTSLVKRKLYVAPMIKSSGGSTVSARITLSKSMPTGSAFVATYGIPKASASFSTTSTTFVTSTASGISFGQIKDLFGVVYLTLELQVPTASGATVVSCRGIATAYEGPRE